MNLYYFFVITPFVCSGLCFFIYAFILQAGIPLPIELHALFIVPGTIGLLLGIGLWREAR